MAKITLSDVDNSRGYEMTVTGSGFNNGTTAGVYVLADASATETPSCESIIMGGTNVGDALVGSDDKVAVTFEVTAPTFKPGNVNYLCMVDGEGPMPPIPTLRTSNWSPPSRWFPATCPPATPSTCSPRTTRPAPAGSSN